MVICYVCISLSFHAQVFVFSLMLVNPYLIMGNGVDFSALSFCAWTEVWWLFSSPGHSGPTAICWQWSWKEVERRVHFEGTLAATWGLFFDFYYNHALSHGSLVKEFLLDSPFPLLFATCNYDHQMGSQVERGQNHVPKSVCWTLESSSCFSWWGKNLVFPVPSKEALPSPKDNFFCSFLTPLGTLKLWEKSWLSPRSPMLMSDWAESDKSPDLSPLPLQVVLTHFANSMFVKSQDGFSVSSLAPWSSLLQQSGQLQQWALVALKWIPWPCQW